MRISAFYSLLAENRFRIGFMGVTTAFSISLATLFNSTMYAIQQLRFGSKIAETELEAPPIFIVGHWRSGTTFLHELMVRNKKFASPSTYDCFAPNHFLVTSWLIPKIFGWVLPRRRPMDNMQAGFERPQEDEFAICVMDAPTPYRRMAFPNHPPKYQNFLNMKDVDEAELERFKNALCTFFKSLTLHYQQQLVLKSPPHTGRIELLSKWFPGAKFVHLSRNPFEVYASTIRLWETLDRNQGFQIPKYDDEAMSEFVLESFELMYEGYREQVERVPQSDLIEIKYETLVKDPARVVERIYNDLSIEGFESAKEDLEKFLETQKDYRPSAYDLDEATRAKIYQRWSWYFERYGYPAN